MSPIDLERRIESAKKAKNPRRAFDALYRRFVDDVAREGFRQRSLKPMAERLIQAEREHLRSLPSQHDHDIRA